jgi:hypothetical protein
MAPVSPTTTVEATFSELTEGFHDHHRLSS